MCGYAGIYMWMGYSSTFFSLSLFVDVRSSLLFVYAAARGAVTSLSLAAGEDDDDGTHRAAGALVRDDGPATRSDGTTRTPSELK